MIKTKDGLELFTREWTIADPKACVVMTHGFGEHSGRYAHVGEAFNRAGFSAYAYDLRGHGQSSGPRGHTPSHEHFLDDLSRVITRVKQVTPNKPLIAYGHSMGGNITLAYVLQRPAGFHACTASAPWIKRAVEGPAWQLALARLMSGIAPSFSQTTPSLQGMLSRDPAVDQANAADPLCHSTMSARLFMSMSGAADMLLAQAASFKTPLLMTHGSADPVISVEGSRAFFEACGAADKTLNVTEGGLHELHNDLGREDYLHTMTAWMDAHRGRA